MMRSAIWRLPGMTRRVATVASWALLLHCVFSATAGCPYTAYEGVDLNGGDLPNQPVSTTLSTLDQCAALCCSMGFPCAAFALNAGSPDSRSCYLKASSGWSNTSIPGVESGLLTNPPPAPVFPWFNTSLPRDQRLQALVAAMTLGEQISWLDDGCPAIPRLGLPAYSWEAEALHGVSWAGVATVFPEPIAWGATFDVPLVSTIANVVAVEARAKWVDGLASDGGSEEFFGLSFMTPNNNLFVDPRWGRGQETFGEDPTLTSAITAAIVTGLQFGDDPNYNKMIATSKHWLAYHVDSWKSDKQYRLSHSFNLSETDIAQYYVRPFAAAIQSNVSAVMCAYDGANVSSPNPLWPHPTGPEPWGVPMCLHPNLQQLLRDQLGFQGYIISDAGAITFAGPDYHGYTPNVTLAACLAMDAGTDLALGGEFGPSLASCISSGLVNASRIQQAITRLMTAQFQLGWFDTIAALRAGVPDPVPYNAVSVANNVSTPEHRALSLQAARESLVLLKNSGGLLPLTASRLKKIALVGPAADYVPADGATGSYLGNYAPCLDGPGGDLDTDPRCAVLSLKDALTNFSTGASITFSYAPGCDINTANDTSGFSAAVEAVTGADVIIAAMGLNTCQETACSEGEADDRLGTLDLPGSQLPLLQALLAAAPDTPVVLVLLNGGPLSSPWAYTNAQAVLEAWYPGYSGGQAIVDALFGAVSPAGRLPVTIVSGVDQLPLYTDFFLSTAPGRTHWYYSGTPLYPFGFGLSYANFTYSDLVISPSVVKPGQESVVVSGTVTHASGQASDEVVQVYGSFQAESVGYASIPKQQLLGFARYHDLAPGSVTAVSITVPLSQLQLVTPAGDMALSSGVWTITLGGGPPSNAEYPGGSEVLVGKLEVA